MNWVDFVVLAVLALIAYRAYVNGFVRELVSLSAVILAIPLAGALFDDMYPKVEPIVDDAAMASLISFLAIFLGVVVGGVVAAHLLRSGVRLLNLGAVDSIAGGAFGLLKGVLLTQSILIALVIFPNPDLRGSIDGSPVARRLLSGSPLILVFLPGSFERGLDNFLDGLREVANGVGQSSD